MTKIKDLLKRVYNGINYNFKVSVLRTGVKVYKNPKLLVHKGIQYIYDDVSHTKGRVLFKPTNAKPKTYYFGCGDRFKLYETEKERDEMHKAWYDEQKVAVKSAKEYWDKEKKNGTGNKSVVFRLEPRKSSRIARRQRWYKANKETVLK